MNLGVLGFFSLLLLPLMLGAAVLRSCGVSFASDRLAYPGWAWVVGTTGTGLVTFAWLWTGTSLDQALPLQLTIFLLAASLYAAGRRRVEAVAGRPRSAFPVWERGVFFAAVTLALVVTGVRIASGNLEPLCHGDDAAFWSLKAKVIYANGGFNQAFADVMSVPQFVYHKDYPLLSPLLHVWTFAQAGEITQVANRIPAQMFSLALVLILAAGLRRVARPAVAAALLVCLMPLPEMVHQARTAYVDQAVAVGVVMAFDVWSRWRSSRSDAGAAVWWRLFCLTLAFTLWSKHEGLLYVLAMLAAWLVCRPFEARAAGGRRAPSRRADKRMLLVPLGILLLTWSFNAWCGFQSYVVTGHARDESLIGSFVVQLAVRLPVISSYFGREIVLNPTHSNLLPLAFLVLSASVPRRIWRGDLRVPTLAFFFAFCAYAAVFVATPAEIGSHLRTAAERVSYQLVPAIALWLGSAGRLLDAALAAKDGSNRLD